MRSTTKTTAAILAAAAAVAGIIAMSAGPQNVVSVSAFTPPSTRRPIVVVSGPSSSHTPIWSSVVEAEIEAAMSADDKTKQPQQQKKKKKSKSTKVTPKASSANNGKAVPRNGKRAKNGKSPKNNGGGRRKFKNKSALKSKIKNEDLLPLSSLKLGQTITGYVAAIADFGAFVKTQYKLDGGGGRSRNGSGYALLHISQISDDRVENVADVLEVGQELKGLRVTDVNYAKGEVGVSLRTKRPKRFPLSVARRGEEMEGRVASVVPYGAFVDVGCRVNALLHVSRMSTEEVIDISNHVKEGDYVKVRIIDVDQKNKKMACSMLDKKADEYLDRRKRQRERKMEAQRMADQAEYRASGELQTELKYFEEALQELENAFKD